MRIKLYISILISLFLGVSCSVSDVLKPSDGVEIVYMETKDTVQAIPGDTISFKFMASTNVGYLTRMQLTEFAGNFTALTDSIRFALTDDELELTMDKDGYLSRPVTTIMFIYPVVIGNSVDVISDLLRATFKVDNSEGKSSTITINTKVINYYDHNKACAFYKKPGEKSGPCFYNPKEHRAYTSIKSAEEKVAMVAGKDAAGFNYVLSPAYSETIDMLKTDGYEFDETLLKETVFMELKDVDFTFFNDDDFKKLDFKNATHKLLIKDQMVVAFKTSDGRCGVFLYEQEDVTAIKTKYQVLPLGKNS